MNTGNFFRVKEDMRKIDYIINNSDITIQTIEKAAGVSVANPYHNFDHGLGVSAQAIRLAKAEHRRKAEVNLVGTVGLFHDSGYRLSEKPFPEIKSFEVAKRVIDESDTRCISLNHEGVLLQLIKYIKATAYPSARTPQMRQDPLKCIIQDADLGHLGQGPFYWVWASMGLLDEFNQVREEHVSPEYFIRTTQEKFVKSLRELQEGEVFVSEGSKEIYQNPLKSMEEVKRWPLEAINFAYGMRKMDINIHEFETKIINRFL